MEHPDEIIFAHVTNKDIMLELKNQAKDITFLKRVIYAEGLVVVLQTSFLFILLSRGL